MDKLKKHYNKYIFDKRQNYSAVEVSSNTDEDIFLDNIAEKLAGGTDILCVKNCSMPQMEFLEICKKIKILCAEFDTIFLINGRADIVLLSEADGVHLEPEEISPHSARELLGENSFIGISVKNIQQLAKVSPDEIDYILAEPDISEEISDRIKVPCFINGNPIEKFS